MRRVAGLAVALMLLVPGGASAESRTLGRTRLVFPRSGCGPPGILGPATSSGALLRFHLSTASPSTQPVAITFRALSHARGLQPVSTGTTTVVTAQHGPRIHWTGSAPRGAGSYDFDVLFPGFDRGTFDVVVRNGHHRRAFRGLGVSCR